MGRMFWSSDQEARQLVCRYLSIAQEIAGPAAKSGDLLGSCEVWECTLRMLVATVKGAKKLKADFRKVMESPDGLVSTQSRLNTIRDVVQPLLDEYESAPHVTVSREQSLRYIREFINLAIEIGAPSYNAGDQRGCYEVYACTARLLLKIVGGAEEAKDRLKRALETCLSLHDPDQQAWAMRRGFDDVLAGSFAGPVSDATPKMREYLSRAIQVGAPAYNAGDHHGCYQAYAATANLILETIPGSPQSKAVLREALRECESEGSASEQAWILRRAFDRLLTEEAEE